MTNRRDVIKTIVAGSALASTSTLFSSFKDLIPLDNNLKGNINHSVCRWTYGFLSLDELCQLCEQIGIKAIDLVGPSDWETLQKYGLYSSMCNGAEINLVDGFGEVKFHEQLVKNYTNMIPLVAKAGYKNLICFSGNRRGMRMRKG